MTTPATSGAGAEVEFEVTATDAQDGALTPACTAASGATFAIGTTTVECTVTDSGGLTDTGSFTVTVTNNAPAIHAACRHHHARDQRGRCDGHVHGHRHRYREWLDRCGLRAGVGIDVPHPQHHGELHRHGWAVSAPRDRLRSR